MELFYKNYGSRPAELIVLHGLLGSGRNWHTVCAGLAEKRGILVPDMRNHGRSPHAAEHHLADMVDDVLELQNRHEIQRSFLLGHSMGGLVTMDFAFRHPERVTGLIVIDISPRPHRATVAFVLDAMLGIDLRQMRSKNAIDEALARSIPDPLVRQFVMTNLHTTDAGFAWRSNVPALKAFLLESKAYQPAADNIFQGPALFIRGGRSDYVRDADFATIRHHFPEVQFETVEGAGHWVHHEAPEAILQIVSRFVDQVEKNNN